MRSKILLLFLCAILPLSANSSPLNLDKSGLALEGFDPVSYFQTDADKKGPIKGNPQFKAQYEGATYFFANAENKKSFLDNPTKYSPAFGGWCAYAVAEKKEKVEIDPKSFVIQDGRLLLFFKGLFADTRDKWLNTKTKNPMSYLKQADANWTEVKEKVP